MRSVRIVQPRRLDFIDIEEPRIAADDDVKIHVAYSGICVDDMPFYRKDNDMLAWGAILFPLTSHEMSGVIVEMGPNAKRAGFKEGDRVSGYAWNQCGECYYCRSGKESHCLNLKPSQGTMSEYIVWKARQLIQLPQSVSLEEGCLADPIGFTMHGIDRSRMAMGDKVLISGGLANGLLLLQLARMQGASSLTVMDPVTENRNLALALGAEHVIDPTSQNVSSTALRITNQLGFDVIFETSHDINTLALAGKLLARHGTLAYSSIYGLDHLVPIKIAELYLKEATLTPFYMAPYMLPRIQAMMERLTLQPLITKIYSFDDVNEAYAAAETGMYPHVLVRHPWV